MSEEASSSYIESLTAREMDVLRLLAEGLSNQEIAETLVMEVGTVKWYNTQIYGKLQVKNRRQAVTRALTLGILEADADDPLQRLHHNLPADTLPFIGRVREIAELVQQLTSEDIRLITILAPGGMGKTRLSIEVGRHLLSYFVDGVYFLPLAPVSSAEQIVTSIAEQIGFEFHNDEQPRQQLLKYLRKQHLLLIADNFEHLVEHGGLLTSILHAAPKVKVLASSREKLDLEGELVFSLGGLMAPFNAPETPLHEYDAVKLFLESARRSASPVMTEDLDTVARICHLLDGMPLAIKLAAAWADTLPIADIETEIRAGLEILEGQAHDAPQRHQSIEAVFDSSWTRRSAQEQGVFMRLSVFREGFTREAAKAVAGAGLRDLQHLVHSAFLQLLPSGRYAVHELMRQYGEHKLAASGELDSVCDTHAQYFAEFITAFGNNPWMTTDHESLQAVNADFENLRAAWTFRATQKNTAELRRFLDGIWLYCDFVGRSQEGIDLLEAVLADFELDEDDDSILLRGQFLTRLAWFYSDTGLHEQATMLAEAALSLLLPFDAAEDLLQTYLLLVFLSRFSNRREQQSAWLDQGLALLKQNRDSKWRDAYGLAEFNRYRVQGDYHKALEFARTMSENFFYHYCLAAAMNDLGDHTSAEQHFLAIEKLPSNHIGYMEVYGELAYSAAQSGHYDRAWRYLQKGLRYADEHIYLWGLMGLLVRTLDLFIGEADYAPAVAVLALVEHHPATTDATRAKIAQKGYQAILEARLPPEDFAAAWARGQQLDLSDLITELMER